MRYSSSGRTPAFQVEDTRSNTRISHFIMFVLYKNRYIFISCYYKERVAVFFKWEPLHQNRQHLEAGLWETRTVYTINVLDSICSRIRLDLRG